MKTDEMLTTKQIDTSATVNGIVAQYPETIGVFNQFGIDTCCGGGVPVADAAHRDAADIDALVAALDAAINHR